MSSRRSKASKTKPHEGDLPDIRYDDTFREVVRKLACFIEPAIELPSTFEQLRTTATGNALRILVDHLVKTCENPATVNALLALKWYYASDEEQQGLGVTRSNACEIVAWRFLSRFTEQETLDYCLHEIPEIHDTSQAPTPLPRDEDQVGEASPLLGQVINRDRLHPNRPVGSTGKRTQLLSSLSRLTQNSEDDDLAFEDPTIAFEGLNALEIAAIANAKRFLSQHIVQKIITGIWHGDIIFWESMSLNATKKPRFYNPRSADPFSRLRVPKYIKCYEVVFFAVFLCLYYTVLVRGIKEHITVAEVALFCWFAAFFYDEVSEWMDAGSIFYTTDIWNIFDMIVISIGFAFAILRIIGLIQNNSDLNDWAFDVLSLEALFMIPRICSILSLSPYWGTLIPCLKEMGKDFIKFMVLVVIFYLGFLTTFCLIGHDAFGVSKMVNILTRIFFGSGYLGFDIMNEIDPIFGPPLMITFVILTNFLLMGSLTGILSNSFLRVTNRAREEYLYVYAVFILEASTSNRLTHFFPPFNLLALFIFRPWALLFPKSPSVRTGRIMLLKITHLPIVAVIKIYELIKGQQSGRYRLDLPESIEPRGRKPRPALSLDRPSAAIQPATIGQVNNRDRSRSQVDDLDDDGSGVEAQLQELHRKIDLLTQTLVAMQEKQNSFGATSA